MSITTETIQNLTPIFGGIGAIVLLILLYIHIPLVKFYELNAVKKDKHHSLALDVLKQELTSPETKELLTERLEQAAFAKYFGIDVEKHKRKLLINFHKKHQHKITWNEIREANRFIFYQESSISIELSKSDKFEYWALLIAMAMCYLSAILIFLMAILATTIETFQPTKNLLTSGILVIVVFLYIFGGFLFRKHTLGNDYAKKIKNLLKDNCIDAASAI